MKILVNGAKGKMGQLVCHALFENTHLTLAGISNSTDELIEHLQSRDIDIVIDFTHPKSVYQNANLIIEANKRPIIGTTGLTASEIEQLQLLCQKKSLGGIIAPNFSLGAILMMKYSALIAQQLNCAEIIEYHHPQKADAPSGTALKTAQIIQTIWETQQNLIKEIPMHSIRLPGILANQSVLFGSEGETLTLEHTVIDRKCFIPGIRYACEKVMTLHELVFGLENILF